jgi:hypothetical protein
VVVKNTNLGIQPSFHIDGVALTTLRPLLTLVSMFIT